MTECWGFIGIKRQQQFYEGIKDLQIIFGFKLALLTCFVVLGWESKYDDWTSTCTSFAHLKYFIIHFLDISKKGQFTAKLKNKYFFATCSSFYPSKLFWFELQSFRDIKRRDVFLLLSIIKVCDTQLVVHTSGKRMHFKNPTAMPLCCAISPQLDNAHQKISKLHYRQKEKYIFDLM